MVESSRADTRRRVLFVLPDMDKPPTKGYQVRCLAIAGALGDRYISKIVAARSVNGGGTLGADRRAFRFGASVSGNHRHRFHRQLVVLAKHSGGQGTLRKDCAKDSARVPRVSDSRRWPRTHSWSSTRLRRFGDNPNGER